MSLAAIIVLIVAVWLLLQLLIIWRLVWRVKEPTDFDRRMERQHELLLEDIARGSGRR